MDEDFGEMGMLGWGVGWGSTQGTNGTGWYGPQMSVKAEDCTSDLAGLTAEELDVLRDWEEKFTKYPVVGRVIG